MSAHGQRPSTLGAVVALAAVASATSACDRTAPTEASPPEPSVAAPAPVDHLAPGELVPGPERAFTLVLPRGFHVDGAFADAAYAIGPGEVHPVTQYFRARLQGGGLREGESSATFEHVHTPDEPQRDLRVHVANVAAHVRVEVDDTTQPAAPTLPDERSRWRQVGLTPNGRLADPTHLD